MSELQRELREALKVKFEEEKSKRKALLKAISTVPTRTPILHSDIQAVSSKLSPERILAELRETSQDRQAAILSQVLAEDEKLRNELLEQLRAPPWNGAPNRNTKKPILFLTNNVSRGH